ncbi:MAG: hypothetical protein GY716_07345 [bacterium]|nr:hypothetical protein [bacterium]
MTKKLNNDDLEKVTGATADFSPPEDGPAPRNWGNVARIKRSRNRTGTQQDPANRPGAGEVKQRLSELRELDD